jgi:small subunit ribosomal protein S6
LAHNVYEGLFILDSNRYGREPVAVSGQVNEIVRKHGGEILASRLWEERRLAYPIDGHRKGTYWLAYFKLESQQLIHVQRDCQLSESILRSLVLKVDPRIVDALVAHALAGGVGVKEKRPAPETPAEQPAVELAPDESANEAEEVAS